jgi:phage shock protein A
MEQQKPENIQGMSVKEAREYILRFITTTKLNERQIQNLKTGQEKWETRMRLARTRDSPGLVSEAEAAYQRITRQIQDLENENTGLKTQIRTMIRQLPGLEARERSIDPDILEQELLMAAGHMPGDEEKPREEREFTALEREALAESALRELKQKMRQTPEDEKDRQE